jgi:hypothetical protein
LLAEKSFAAKGGSIVDGTFVEVPRQRNTREEEQLEPCQAEDFVFADSAYVHHTAALRERGYLPRICEKG